MFIINRVFKKAIAFLSVFAMTQGIAAGAEPALAAESERYIPPHAQLIINYNDFGNIVGYHELMDSDNEVVAYCLDFENGYEIYDDYTVIEFSTENESPYIESGDAYYGGPLSYYEKVGTEYVGIISNEELNQNDFSEMSDTFAEKSIQVEQNYDLEVTESDLMSRALVPDVNVKLPGRMRTYNWNTDDTCGSLAATIMMFYYYDYISTNYLKNIYVSNPYDLYEFFKPKIEDEVNGVYVGSDKDDMLEGLNDAYPKIRASSTGVRKTVCLDVNPSWGFAYNLISNEKVPILLDLKNHPTYYEHWVVVHGVYRINPENGPSVNFHIVNDGWGNNDIRINHCYAESYVYFS